jgi:hypothetical protein
MSVDAATAVAGLHCRDRDLVSLKVAGGGAAVMTGLGDALPEGVDVDAVSILDDGTVVFSTASSFVAGGVAADDEDLVALQGSVLSVVFDGGSVGLPVAADIDAVHVVTLAPLELYFSVETPTEIAGTVYSDGDILHFDGSTVSRVVAESTILGAEARRCDVDGLWVDPSRDEYVISLDVSIAGVSSVSAADDEDLLLWTNSLLLVLMDGSSSGLAAPGIDVDAVHVESILFADDFETGDTSAWSSMSN